MSKEPLSVAEFFGLRPNPLRAARLRAGGMRLEDYAAQIGISKQALSRYELGQVVPRPARMRRMAEVYGLPLEEVARFYAEAK